MFALSPSQVFEKIPDLLRKIESAAMRGKAFMLVHVQTVLATEACTDTPDTTAELKNFFESLGLHVTVQNWSGSCSRGPTNSYDLIVSGWADPQISLKTKTAGSLKLLENFNAIILENDETIVPAAVETDDDNALLRRLRESYRNANQAKQLIYRSKLSGAFEQLPDLLAQIELEAWRGEYSSLLIHSQRVPSGERSDEGTPELTADLKAFFELLGLNVTVNEWLGNNSKGFFRSYDLTVSGWAAG